MIGLSMLLLGRDVESLAWMVRLLALLNPPLLYLLVKRVSGPASGLLAAALVALFGYTAALTISFNVDAAALTAYLLSVLVLLAAVRARSTPF